LVDAFHSGTLADSDLATHSVFASFVITVPGGEGGERVLGFDPITKESFEEKSVFPGFEGTTCYGGRWSNPRGKATSGNPTNPHPHCVGTTPGELQVTLEEISAIFDVGGQGGVNQKLMFTLDDDEENDNDYMAKFIGSGPESNWVIQAKGVIHAWAVDQHNNRVGHIVFDLGEIDLEGVVNVADMFDYEGGEGCTSTVIA
jgi:hypothetical protein